MGGCELRTKELERHIASWPTGCLRGDLRVIKLPSRPSASCKPEAAHGGQASWRLGHPVSGSIWPANHALFWRHENGSWHLNGDEDGEDEY